MKGENVTKAKGNPSERAFKVIVAPYFSEKGTNITANSNQYTFKVAADADKVEIKHAVESLFNVVVESVNTINTHAKSKRFKQMLGKRNAFKKAFVKLKQGCEINFVEKE
jgi:large subunit ribosomal protein L23